MKNSFAVIGLGRFGRSVAINLANKGAEVLAIDNREHVIEDLRDEVAYAVCMDATDLKALKSHNIHEMDAAIVAIGTDFESLLLITVNLMELGVERIVARAMSKTQRVILERIGLKEIVAPETEVGRSLAEKLMNPGILTFMQLPDEYEIVEIETPPLCVDRSLQDIDLRRKYNLNLITIKRCKQQELAEGEEPIYHIVGIPDGETKLLKTDTLLVMGRDKDISRFIDVNQ